MPKIGTPVLKWLDNMAKGLMLAKRIDFGASCNPAGAGLGIFRTVSKLMFWSPLSFCSVCKSCTCLDLLKVLSR